MVENQILYFNLQNILFGEFSSMKNLPQILGYQFFSLIYHLVLSKLSSTVVEAIVEAALAELKCLLKTNCAG